MQEVIVGTVPNIQFIVFHNVISGLFLIPGGWSPNYQCTSSVLHDEVAPQQCLFESQWVSLPNHHATTATAFPYQSMKTRMGDGILGLYSLLRHSSQLGRPSCPLYGPIALYPRKFLHVHCCESLSETLRYWMRTKKNKSLENFQGPNWEPSPELQHNHSTFVPYSADQSSLRSIIIQIREHIVASSLFMLAT